MKLPKLKTLVRIKQHRLFQGLIKPVTISQVPSGKYFASVLVEENWRWYTKLNIKLREKGDSVYE